MTDSKYLQMLAEKYPNHRSVKAEIINLRAILALPKGTEYFLSDLHGEYDAFQYFVRSASGTIKMKIDEHFSGITQRSGTGVPGGVNLRSGCRNQTEKKNPRISMPGANPQFIGWSLSADPYPVNTPGQKYVGFCRTTRICYGRTSFCGR